MDMGPFLAQYWDWMWIDWGGGVSTTPPLVDPPIGPQHVPVPWQRLCGIYLHIVGLLGAKEHGI